MSAEIVDFPRERLGSLDSVRCRTAPTERKKSEVQALVSARANPSAVWDLADLYLPIRVRNFSALFFGPKVAAGLWRSAFVAGWRAANGSKTVKDF